MATFHDDVLHWPREILLRETRRALHAYAAGAEPDREHGLPRWGSIIAGVQAKLRAQAEAPAGAFARALFHQHFYPDTGDQTAEEIANALALLSIRMLRIAARGRYDIAEAGDPPTAFLTADGETAPDVPIRGVWDVAADRETPA